MLTFTPAVHADEVLLSPAGSKPVDADVHRQASRYGVLLRYADTNDSFVIDAAEGELEKTRIPLDQRRSIGRLEIHLMDVGDGIEAPGLSEIEILTRP